MPNMNSFLRAPLLRFPLVVFVRRFPEEAPKFLGNSMSLTMQVSGVITSTFLGGIRFWFDGLLMSDRSYGIIMASFLSPVLPAWQGIQSSWIGPLCNCKQCLRNYSPWLLFYLFNPGEGIYGLLTLSLTGITFADIFTHDIRGGENKRELIEKLLVLLFGFLLLTYLVMYWLCKMPYTLAKLFYQQTVVAV